MQKYSTCTGCALYDAPMAVNEKITNPHIVVVGGFPLEEDCKKAPFAAYKSMVVKKLLLGILNSMPAHKKPVIAYTYATMCCPKDQGFKVDAETVYKCASNLMSYLDRMRPKVIVAMGADATKSLGIKGSQSDVRGGAYTIRLSDGTECRCIATYHIAQVDKSPGLLPVLQNDLQKAVTLASTDADDFKMNIKTAVAFDDVVALLDEVEADLKAATAEMVGTTRKLIVAVDTETTSVLPWHPDTRLIAVSMSYNNSSGIAYPVTHVMAGYTPAQIAFILERTEQILSLPYLSIVMSNGKFDTQWLRYKYQLRIPEPEHDTMLLEHVLEEDKKGEYGLKDLIRDRVPALSGYEGELHEDLEAITAARHAAAKSAVDTLKEQYVEAVGVWWVAKLDDSMRSALLARWVDAGLLQMSETASLSKVKFKKTKDRGLVPTKGYMDQIVKLVRSIPEDTLEAGDPAFAASIKDLKAQMAEAAEVKLATFEDIDIQKLLTYAAIDAFGTRTIFGMQLSRARKEAAVMDNINKRLQAPLPTPPITTPYSSITMPMCNVLADMEYGGIRFDRDKALQYIEVVKEKMAEKLDSMYTEVGYKFNTSASAPDLARILYTEMGLPVLKTTDSGAPSTDADTLKELSDRHDNPFLNTILEYRKLDKCVNTYLISWYNKSAVDGKIHCSYNQIGTATYRLSSSNPNLQNVPFFLKEANLNLKALFIPDSDEFDFHDLDISNAEMRVLCGYSNDEKLISVFNDNKDIHCLTAAGISDYSYDDIVANKENKETDQYNKRQIAKKVNFGTIYCMSAKTLQEKLWSDMRISVTEEQAQEYLSKFFATYPGVADYIEDTKAFVEAYKFTYTFTGRRRRFPYASFSRSQLGRVQRQAVNARIQTTSSDMVAMNLINVHNAIKPLGGRVLITVHDSIGFQLPKGTTGVKALLDKAIIEATARDCQWLPVVWKYDVAKGPNYGDVHEKVS